MILQYYNIVKSKNNQHNYYHITYFQNLIEQQFPSPHIPPLHHPQSYKINPFQTFPSKFPLNPYKISKHQKAQLYCAQFIYSSIVISILFANPKNHPISTQFTTPQFFSGSRKPLKIQHFIHFSPPHSLLKYSLHRTHLKICIFTPFRSSQIHSTISKNLVKSTFTDISTGISPNLPKISKKRSHSQNYDLSYNQYRLSPH